MRTIRYTNRFKRDYRREKTGRHSKTLDDALMEIVNLLVADIHLPYRNFDHPISGEWINHRNCHIKPDLILIYRKIDTDHYGEPNHRRKVHPFKENHSLRQMEPPLY